jgi:hypothetical protein
LLRQTVKWSANRESGGCNPAPVSSHTKCRQGVPKLRARRNRSSTRTYKQPKTIFPAEAHASFPNHIVACAMICPLDARSPSPAGRCAAPVSDPMSISHRVCRRPTLRSGPRNINVNFTTASGDWLGLALKFSEQPHIFVLIDKLDFFDATKPSCVSELWVSP